MIANCYIFPLIIFALILTIRPKYDTMFTIQWELCRRARSFAIFASALRTSSRPYRKSDLEMSVRPYDRTDGVFHSR